MIYEWSIHANVSLKLNSLPLRGTSALWVTYIGRFDEPLVMPIELILSLLRISNKIKDKNRSTSSDERFS
jgi:hypothetical protein